MAGLRSTGSTTIAFGLVSVPVKLFTATSAHDLKFNTLHEKCGGRVKQKLHCPVCAEDVEHKDTRKGFEVSKDQYVSFEPSELKGLEPEAFQNLQIEAFVDASKVDYIYVEKSLFVGPNKGADQAFNLLVKAMRHTEKVAVGRYMSRGRVYVCMLRPYQKGMLLHHLYYADEVRDYNEVDLGADTPFSDKQLALANKLVNELSVNDFDPSMFKDVYRDNVQAAIEAKSEGKAVVLAPAAQPKEQVVDLFDALKASLADAKGSKAKSKAKPKKKAAG
jgi:DNA end-binding protein Ku